MDFRSFGHHAPMSEGVGTIPNSVDTAAVFPPSFKKIRGKTFGGNKEGKGQEIIPPSFFRVDSSNHRLSLSLRQISFVEERQLA